MTKMISYITEEDILAVAEELKIRAGKAMDAIDEFKKATEILTTVIDEFAVFNNYAFQLRFCFKLIQLGLPYRVANQISSKWPRRWLPIDWIWGDLFDE